MLVLGRVCVGWSKRTPAAFVTKSQRGRPHCRLIIGTSWWKGNPASLVFRFDGHIPRSCGGNMAGFVYSNYHPGPRGMIHDPPHKNQRFLNMET